MLDDPKIDYKTALNLPDLRQSASGWTRWLWIALAVIVADRITKVAVQAMLNEGDSSVVAPFFSIVLTFNTGAAFSFLAGAGGWQRWLFAVIAAVAAIFIVALLRRGGGAFYCAGLALILGGALGNLYDRIALGRVVDFLLFHYAGWSYPAFNVADSAITVGAALIVVESFKRKRDAAGAAKGI